MFKRLRLFCVLLCGTLLLAGCSSFSFGATGDLLRAPALGGDPGDIQKALTAWLGQEPEYKYPKEGETHSPLLLVDLDGDGEQEGVVFYSLPESANNNVHIAVLRKESGEWQVVDDKVGGNTEIASVDVADMFGGGTRQLVVGFANASLGGKALSVFEYAGDTLTPFQHGSYNSYLLDDFTDRGGTDLAVVSGGEEGLVLHFITGRGGAVEYLQNSAITLQTQISTCVGIYASVDGEDRRFLVVDGSMEAPPGFLATQILVYSESSEQFYMRENESAAQVAAINATARGSLLLTSRDIDADGTVETPVLPQEYEGLVEDDLGLSFLVWRDFTAEEPLTKQFGLFDAAAGLYVQMPLEWEGNVRVAASATGWRVRPQESARTLLEYRVLEEGEEAPEGAWYITGVNACLVPSSSLNAIELLEIDTELLL